MAIELKVPSLGESITEVEIGDWLKQEGDAVAKDEEIVAIESEKATVNFPSPDSGKLSKIVKRTGEAAKVGEVIAVLEPGAKPSPESKSGPRKTQPKQKEKTQPPSRQGQEKAPTDVARPAARGSFVMPAAERVLAEHGLSPDEIRATGPGGRLLKEDVERFLREGRRPEAPSPSPAKDRAAATSARGRDEVVPMSALRRKIAARMVEAQQTAALLTTMNEIDMGELQRLRKQFGPRFQETHGVKLGMMSFFVKATVEALKEFPVVNAEVRGNEVLYHYYYDIGVAVGGGRGLVVPVLRQAERLSFAEIEKAIHDFAVRARENKLLPEELKGGTFTISNGGVFGSLLSTPIINPPQSGILGMHALQERAVAREGAIVARPMMYVALTYDHRIVDGREAVTFLRRIKDLVENPARMLLEV